MGQDDYYRELGAALGYPPCCVDDFVRRSGPAPDRAFWGTGYVPCSTCDRAARIMGRQAFVAQHIAPTRRVLTPFPVMRDDDPILAGIRARHGLRPLGRPARPPSASRIGNRI